MIVSRHLFLLVVLFCGIHAADVCVPTTCGNGQIDNSAEECDDGNTNNGDGCSNLCTVTGGFNCTATAAVFDVCGDLVKAGGKSVCSSRCGDGYVTPNEQCDFNGVGCTNCRVDCGYECTMQIKLGVPTSECHIKGGDKCGNGHIDAGEECDDGNRVCGDGCSSSCVRESGWTCNTFNTGNSCRISSCTNICGNGRQRGFESCDDGNLISGDGCTSSCSTECGYVCPYDPTLDRGVCKTICGDGLRAGTEECDDGNTADGDGCSSTCKTEGSRWVCTNSFGCGRTTCVPKCGDGLLTGSETCDDGNSNNNDGCSSSCKIECGYKCDNQPSVCTVVKCGDGIVSNKEACDDGNNIDGDGCSSVCQLESDFSCSLSLNSGSTCSKSVCTERCGNGKRSVNEACDDGNASNGDGCSNTCQIQCGYNCANFDLGTKTVCTRKTTTSNPATSCGDGIVEGDEECDDGNIETGDGCSSSCKREPNFSCVNPSNCGKSVCTPVCGNGILQKGEVCDDGNNSNFDGCNSQCTLVECGYRCDTNTALKSICTFTLGDGTKSQAENCDDGNLVNNDGCSASGVIESTSKWSCVNNVIDAANCVRTSCTDRCGSGVISGAEQCDDGNTFNGDGCSSTCTRECGFDCSTNVNGVSVCSPICGDGRTVTAYEACDDGNKDSGDGCDSSCRRENSANTVGLARWTFASDNTLNCDKTCPYRKTIATNVCGDGFVYGTEQCDDGNNNLGDGCEFCVRSCGYYCSSSVANGQSKCETRCGDGLRAGGEQCDDGNAVDGDGCSSTCTLEDTNKWSCTTIGCTQTVCIDRCGNGVRRGTEECDDGDNISSNGCSSTCKKECGHTCTEDSAGKSQCTAAKCGDGVKAPSEQCDDGNTNSGDGCSSTCVTETGYSCIGPGSGVCGLSTCNANCGDGRVMPSEKCDDNNFINGDGCSGCAIDCGFTCPNGLNCTPTKCGDGLRAFPEACDDGNNNNGDGCSSTCTIESGYSCTNSNCAASQCTTTCNDGLVTGNEVCDDGNKINNDGCSATCGLECGWQCTRTIGQRSTCTAVKCGDGLVAGFESCDDGNTNANDGCSPSCVLEDPFNFACTTNFGSCNAPATTCIDRCGNGKLGASEGCDDGNNINGDGCSSSCQLECGYKLAVSAPSIGAIGAVVATCGDGIFVDRWESCDDGNTNDGDGCSSTCRVEAHFKCSGCDCSRSTCTPLCGSGLATGNEACDDSNLFSGDGCSSTCQVEPGFTCTDGRSFPSVCTVNSNSCGDGIVMPGENCDDGNQVSGDGCSKSCQKETGFNCDSSKGTTVCVKNVCGDGIVLSGVEDCDPGSASISGCINCKLSTGYRCTTDSCGNHLSGGQESCDDGNTWSGDGCSSTCVRELIFFPPPDGILNGDGDSDGDGKGKGLSGGAIAGIVIGVIAGVVIIIVIIAVAAKGGAKTAAAGASAAASSGPPNLPPLQPVNVAPAPALATSTPQ